jgi:hypothetical protein
MQEKRTKRADRLQLMLTHDEILLVDHWRFDHRMPSRSAAVRALLRLGIDNSRAMAGTGDIPLGVASADVGILSTDRKVDRAIGVLARQSPILIAGNDMLVAHAASSLLAGLGVPLEGPHEDPDAIQRALQEGRPRAAVIALDPLAKDLEKLIDVLAPFEVSTVVLAPEATQGGDPPTDLGLALGHPVIVRIPDVLDTLVGIVRAMLDDASEGHA